MITATAYMMYIYYILAFYFKMNVFVLNKIHFQLTYLNLLFVFKI